MKANPGYCPADAAGRRVNVWLGNGQRAENWPADGRAGCDWTLRDHPYSIAFYEVRT